MCKDLSLFYSTVIPSMVDHKITYRIGPHTQIFILIQHVSLKSCGCEFEFGVNPG